MTNKYLATLLISLTAKAAIGDPLVDPTRPATHKQIGSTTTVAALRLEAILRSNDAHVAIVNGKVVRAGDHIGAARIDAIDGSSIRYTRDGRSHTARLDAKAIQVRQNVVPNEDET